MDDWRRDLSPQAEPPPMLAERVDSSPALTSDLRPGEQCKEKRKTAGRFDSINAFADFSLASLNRAEIAVWLLLWRDTRPDGLARTSLADLAMRGGMDRQTAFRAVQRLEGLGLLLVVRRGGLNQGPTWYRVIRESQGRGP